MFYNYALLSFHWGLVFFSLYATALYAQDDQSELSNLAAVLSTSPFSNSAAKQTFVSSNTHLTPAKSVDIPSLHKDLEFVLPFD